MALADLLFSGILLLNLTGVFSFAAPLLDVKVAVVSAAMLLCNLTYLAYRYPRAWDIVRQPLPLLWGVALLWWPLLTAAYSPVLSVRAMGLQAYFATLMLGAAVFVSVCGWRALQRLAGYAVAITLAGLLLSAVEPGLFTAVARLTESREQYDGRAFGFFLQPNMAAENTIFMSVLWLAGDARPSIPRTWFRVVVMCGTVLITGSRAGFATAVLVGLLSILFAGATSGGVRYSSGVRALRAAAVLIVVLASGALLLSSLKARQGSLVAGGLDRVRSVLALGNRSQLSTDGSGAERLVAAAQYLGYIQRHPVSGYGLGANDYYKASGLLIRSSHNVYLETGFLFGVPYVLFLLLLLALTLRHPARQSVEADLGSAVVLLLVASLALAGMTSNTTLESRVLQTGLGAILGALAYPHLLVRAPKRAAIPAVSPLGTESPEPA